MPDPNVATSIIAVLMIGLVLRGLMPYWRRSASPELTHFALGLSWILGVFLVRTFYWGVLRAAVLAIGPEHWSAWSGVVGGPDWINAAFNVGIVIGCWHVLKAFHAMIPEEERDRWPVVSSPFYPRGWCFMRLGRAFRENWRK